MITTPSQKRAMLKYRAKPESKENQRGYEKKFRRKNKLRWNEIQAKAQRKARKKARKLRPKEVDKDVEKPLKLRDYL